MPFYVGPLAINRTGEELRKPGAYVDIMKPFHDQAKATYDELLATKASLEKAHKELQEDLHWRQIWVLENNVEYLQGRLEDVTKRGEEKLAELEKSAENKSKDTYLKECRIWYLENILLYQQQKADEAAKSAEISQKGANQSIDQIGHESSASLKAPARGPDYPSNASKAPHGHQASVSSAPSFHHGTDMKTNIDTCQDGPVFEEFAFADSSKPSYRATPVATVNSHDHELIGDCTRDLAKKSTPRISRLSISEMDSDTEIFIPMRRVNKRVSFDGFTEYNQDDSAMRRIDHGQRPIPASKFKQDVKVARKITNNSPDTVLLFIVFAVIAGFYQVIRGD